MTPEEQKALLLRVITQFAGKMLRKQAGFFPFGATLGVDRNVDLLLPEGMKKDVTRDELDKYFGENLRRASAEKNRKLAAFCVHVGDLNGNTITPAILVHIEHEESFAVDLFYTYTVTDDVEIVFADPVVQNAALRIFVPA